MRKNRNEGHFYDQIIIELGASKAKSRVQGRYQAYQLDCPNCKRNCARLCQSESGDTYMLLCPACGENLCLNDVINKYGSPELKSEWHEASFGKKWYGIKNRTKPGPKKNFKKDRTQTPIPGLSMDHSKLHARALLEQHKNKNNGQI